MIGLATPDAKGRRPDPEPIVSLDFENDGYYWFLYPLFEGLAERTGQLIDLYGTALFNLPQLDDLQSVITQARLQVEAMPDSWDVLIGWSLGSNYQPAPATAVWSIVYREAFLELLVQFDSVITDARRTGQAIVCLGD